MIKLEQLADWIATAKTVVWFTGAGISTESGLPDFRGPDGVRGGDGDIFAGEDFFCRQVRQEGQR